MIPLDLIQQFRETVWDLGGNLDPIKGYKYPWESDVNDGRLRYKNAEVVRMLNEARRDVAKRAPIEDTMSIALVEGVATYSIPSAVLWIQGEVRLSYWNFPLTKWTSWELARDFPTWKVSTDGIYGYVLDFGAHSITLIGTKVQVPGTLSFSVARMPLTDVEWSKRYEPWVEPDEDLYREAIVFSMARQAYNKRDSQSFDQQKVDEFEALVTSRAGPLPNALMIRERWEMEDFALAVQAY